MNFILLFFTLIVFTLKSLDFIYLFQTKEYRLDRFFVFLREEDLLKLLFGRRIRMPGATIRNLLILQLVLLNTILFTLWFSDMSLIQLLIGLLLSPVFALATIFIGVVLSDVPVQAYRKRIISQARVKIQKSKTIFIGITGSYGKTTTKEFLFRILSQKFKVAKTDKNYNSDIGVAISVIKNLQKDTDYFIAEIGAYRKGEIKTVCDLIKPKYGILTGIGNQHLSLFGSKKSLLEAKAELLESIPHGSMVFINDDIKDKRFFSNKTKAKIVYYSLKNLPFAFKTNLPGEHIRQNLLPCILLAQDLGVEKSVILKAIKNLKPVANRLVKSTGVNNAAILDDSYNSNVGGFMAAIETANDMNYRQKFILSRGLIELGDEKQASYRKIIDRLKRSKLALLTTDRLFKDPVFADNQVILFPDEAKLLNYIKAKADKNTLLIIEGRFEAKTLKELLAYSNHSPKN